MTKIHILMLQCLAIATAGAMLAGCPDNDNPVEEIGDEIEDATEELDDE